MDWCWHARFSITRSIIARWCSLDPGDLSKTINRNWQPWRRLPEHIIPGRWREARLPNPKELNATSVVSISIDEASAKVRSGAPGDDEADYALPVWAGVLPLQELPLTPVRDELMAQDIAVPDYVAKYSRRQK